MHRKTLLALGLWLLVLGSVWAPLDAQRAGSFKGSSDDPAIRYSTTTELNNVVVDINRRLQDGTLKFAFDERSGFLQSALEALRLPVDSQLLVFSRTSLQGRRIGEQNPRALFFNDRVALGWVRGGDLLEVAAHDATAGVVFYTLEQRADIATPPQFKRAFECLGCHVTGNTLGVPGLLMFSTTRPEPSQFSGIPRHIDHSEPLNRRFGGWFVTGSTGASPHMGNEAAAVDGRGSRELASVEGLFDAGGYRGLSSDVVAHLVLTHQAGMTNLLTRAAWEARAVDPALHPLVAPDPGMADRINVMMSGIAREVVDYLLFVDEARFTDRVRGASGFAERFSASGPRDRKGRSLYELDLNRRLMKYPCSYLIYSPAFDAMPALAKDPIYRRLWEVLSGQAQDLQYQSALSLADRQAIVEILRDTKKDLPPYFQNVTR
jgi:hypothetical protein